MKLLLLALVLMSAQQRSCNQTSVVPLRSAKPFAITTLLLPQAFWAKPYVFQLTASGGTVPYKWAIVFGKLPEGLSLTESGLISGIPTGSISPFTIMCVDSSGQAIQKTIAANDADNPDTSDDDDDDLDVRDRPPIEPPGFQWARLPSRLPMGCAQIYF
jgi:hypothetical protein